MWRSENNIALYRSVQKMRYEESFTDENQGDCATFTYLATCRRAWNTFTI